MEPHDAAGALKVHRALVSPPSPSFPLSPPTGTLKGQVRTQLEGSIVHARRGRPPGPQPVAWPWPSSPESREEQSCCLGRPATVSCRGSRVSKTRAGIWGRPAPAGGGRSAGRMAGGGGPREVTRLGEDAGWERGLQREEPAGQAARPASPPRARRGGAAARGRGSPQQGPRELPGGGPVGGEWPGEGGSPGCLL